MLVSFSMSSYNCDAWCDVLLMTACSLLLSCPWQWDNDAIHLCKENAYTMLHEGKSVKLKSLPPKFGNQEDKGAIKVKEEPKSPYLDAINNKKQNSNGKKNNNE